jgi:hypothetical protein
MIDTGSHTSIFIAKIAKCAIHIIDGFGEGMVIGNANCNYKTCRHKSHINRKTIHSLNNFSMSIQLIEEACK